MVKPRDQEEGKEGLLGWELCICFPVQREGQTLGGYSRNAWASV